MARATSEDRLARMLVRLRSLRGWHVRHGVLHKRATRRPRSRSERLSSGNRDTQNKSLNEHSPKSPHRRCRVRAGAIAVFQLPMDVHAERQSSARTRAA
jgi:hypothetical protein